MKVKEITLSEAEVTSKPIPNAMQIAVDGKPVAQANDPAIAQQITQAAKDGKLTMADPTNTGSSQSPAIQEQPANDPQMSALQALLAQAQQPWEQAQIKWRISNLQSQQQLAGEPGGGTGAPVDARGNLIPVLPTKEWMAKNPNVVKQLPNEALPPEMQRPGMIDRLKGLAGIK